MLKRLNTLSLALLLAAGTVQQTVAAEKSWLDMGKGLLDSVLTGDKSESTASTAVAGLSQTDIVNGLKEALKVGSERVVSQLGQNGGFNSDEAIRIPLPSQLQQVGNMLDKVGMGGIMSDLETRLNRAAEQATPKAKALFWDAIKQMSFDDAKRIYNGADDAATQYLREKMSGPLGEALRPIIEDNLSQVGAVKLYDQAMGRYDNIPFMPDVKADLTDHTVNKSMDGIFYYLAQEEAAIRKDPLKRSTELLRKVFGS